MASKNKNYQIQASLNLLVAIEISASSLDDALEKSKKLTENDFVDFGGDYLDGSFRISGVYECEPM